MIRFIKGNLLESSCNIIAHGVNSRGVFGSGLAKQIAIKWPVVREYYFARHKRTGWKLSDIQFVQIEENRRVVNICTQLNYGYDKDVVYVDYNALKSGLDKVIYYCLCNELSLALPKIGCGLANGDWLKVKEIIQDLSVLYPEVLMEIYSC